MKNGVGRCWQKLKNQVGRIFAEYEMSPDTNSIADDSD